jgi:excisionase family DNA binding protein
VAAVAEILNLKPKTVRAWISAGKIGVVRFGRTVRVPESEIRELVIRGRQAKAPRRKA